ncbi:MAG: aspartate aminotransferase family protein [Oligoflexia bacterium]|nr:aspartate aminotransferase family protein [Oligoflexia bacterium]
MNISTKHRVINESYSLNEKKILGFISESEPVATLNSIQVFWKKAIDYNIFDDQGNKWIDFTSGIFVANAGHSNPQIKMAIKQQIDSDLLFAYNYPTEIKAKFYQKIFELSPEHFNKIALLNSGSEAVDLAYKLIKLWATKNKKKYIITFRGSYHGRGLSNDLLSGNKEKALWSNTSDDNVTFIDFPYDSGNVFDRSKLPNHSEIAAFMLETFQGWGAWFYPQQYIDDLCCFAKEIGALICFDEMQSGFYRIGHIYGYMTYNSNLKPDIICLGKGITSSLPLSAVLSTSEIMDIDVLADLHGTHSGNCLCCAAALANLEFLSEANTQKHLVKVIAVFQNKLRELLKKAGAVKQVNSRGLIAGLIFENAHIATNLAKKCVAQGILPVCTNKNSIKLAPPLTISEDALEEGMNVLIEIASTIR